MSRPILCSRRGFVSARSLALGVASAVSTLALPTAAYAGGFSIPDHGARALGRGGAYTVGSKDLTALYYNPGSLAKQRGTRIMLTHNSVFHKMEFARAPLSDDAWGDLGGTEFDPVSERSGVFPLGAFLGVASDFGLENWNFAAGVYGPNSVGSLRYEDEDPGTNYGPQSFMLTSLDVLVLFYSASVAWKYQNKAGKDVFGLGATLQYADMPSMKYALVVDSAVTDGTLLVDYSPLPDDAGTQTLTTLEMKDRTSFTAIIGGWYRPLKQLEIGASARVVPVFFRPQGDVSVDQEGLIDPDEGVTVDMAAINDPDDLTDRGPGITLPVYARGGVRYIFEKKDVEVADIEVDFVWEDWSAIQSYDMTFTGKIGEFELRPVRMPKNWKDTYSVRLGGDYSPLPGFLTLRLGGMFESAASPDAYAHLDFPSFQRFGVSGGVSGGVPGFQVSAGYMHIFQADVTNTEANAKTFQQRPLAPCDLDEFCGDGQGVPANAGTFRSSYDTLGVMIDVNIKELRGFIKKRRGSDPPKAGGPDEAAPAETEP
jgi:long-chain fatty acid transport protein